MRDRIPIILTVLAAVGLTLAASATSTAQAGSIAQPSSAARPSGTASWQPEPASYGVSKPVDISVRMDDGVEISTEVVYPTDPATGARAAGTFPVLLTQNPYGAARSDPTRPHQGTTSSSAATFTSPPPCAAPAPPVARCPGSGSGRARTAPNW